jgi:riboflavin kinase/FMN adenylyltransferase
MQTLHYPDDPIPSRWHGTVLALGNFDGVHRGHARIIDQVVTRATESGNTSAILTFDPHPPRIVRPDQAPRLLMTHQQKINKVAEAGIDWAAVVRFTPEISEWAPNEFVATVLADWLHVSEVWVGANFLFGHDRSGNFTLLRELGVRHGFRAEKIDPVRYKEFVVSSTRIRRLVTDGYVDEAGVLLGHHYVIDGEVVPGARRGQEQGFPTANVLTANEVLPSDGVYATTVTVDGMIYPSVTNIGVRPTFEDQGERLVEAHLLDYNDDLYGMDVRVAFVQRLRDEQTFPDAMALRRQIEIDCANARGLFSRMSL